MSDICFVDAIGVRGPYVLIFLIVDYSAVLSMISIFRIK